MIVSDSFSKIKKVLKEHHCERYAKDKKLLNNCIIAELYDAEITNLTDKKPGIIKGGIGELKITKDKNYFTPAPAAFTAKLSEEQLIQYFSTIQDINRWGPQEKPKHIPTPEEAYQFMKEVQENMPKPPTVTQMAKNFAKATGKWAESGFKVVTKKRFKERLETCRGCSFWDEKARLGMGKCNHEDCGCSKGKLWLKTEKCPIKKWK
tara:strand:- start:3899 stop:4519 length:621 start_codon:yes stop_codon:yes gene_type:complete